MQYTMEMQEKLKCRQLQWEPPAPPKKENKKYLFWNKYLFYVKFKWYSNVAIFL